MWGSSSRCSNPAEPPSTGVDPLALADDAAENQWASRPARRPPGGTRPAGVSIAMPRSSVAPIAQRSRRASRPRRQAEQHVRKARRLFRRPRVVDARRGALRRRILGRQRCGGQRHADHLRRAPASQIRPHDHPFHRDPDLDPQCIDPHPPLPQGVDVPPRLEPLPVVDELPGEVGHRRPERRAALDEHVLRPIVGRVRARMEGDRDVRVAPDAVELLPMPPPSCSRSPLRSRGRGCQVRNGRQHDAGGGRHIGEGDRVVAIDDLFESIRPWGNTGRHVSKRVSRRCVQ